MLRERIRPRVQYAHVALLFDDGRDDLGFGPAEEIRGQIERTKKVVDSLRIIAQNLPFEINYIELEDDEEEL